MRFFLYFLFSFTLLLGQNKTPNLSKEVATIDSLFDTGLYDMAEAEIKNNIEKKGISDPNYYNFLQKQAECLSRLGKIEEAQEVLDKCDFHKMSPSTKIEALNCKGFILLKKGNIDKAIEIFNTASESCILSQKSVLGLCLNNLGLANWTNGNNELASELMLQALHNYIDYYGSSHAKVASVYNNLGLINSSTRPDIALENYQKSLKLNVQLFKANHPSIAIAYTNIGILYKNKNEFTLALDNFEKAIQIYTSIYQDNHPSLAFVNSNIAQVFMSKNSNEKAKEFLIQAKNIYEKSYGKKHPELARIHILLGNINLKEGKIKQALIDYQLALVANSILFDDLNINLNPSTNDCYNKLLLINILTQKAKAIESHYYTKSLKKTELLQAAKIYQICDTAIVALRQNLVNKSDKIQLGAYANDVYEFAIETNLQLAEVSLFKNKYLEWAFYYNEKSKASVLIESIADANAKQFAGIPDSLLAKEKSLQLEISYVLQQIAQKQNFVPEKELLNKLFVLKNQFSQFTERLKIDYPDYFNLKFAFTLANSKEISKLLPKNTVLCSFFVAENSNKVFNFIVKSNALKVYTTSLDLAIDKQVTVFRNAIKYNLPSNFNEISFKLYKILFPFKITSNIKNLVIVPDGKLGTIPYEALLTKKYDSDNYEKAPFLVHNSSFSYAYSSTLYRDAQIKVQPYTQNTALICAPVTFNKNAQKNALISLPASELECSDIRKLLKSNKYETKSYLNEQANESILKNINVSNFKYIHLATHGIVNELHPELSQIYLNSDSQNDGNLYSWEIYGLKLNANLVSLSACQTGLGKVSKGEGIIGLSRALLYAGAQNVMVSLWTVSDASTSTLMVDFYDKLTTDNFSLSQSLQKAKLNMLNNKVFSNPYYWAPFILIGK